MVGLLEPDATDHSLHHVSDSTVAPSLFFSPSRPVFPLSCPLARIGREPRTEPRHSLTRDSHSLTSHITHTRHTHTHTRFWPFRLRFEIVRGAQEPSQRRDMKYCTFPHLHQHPTLATCLNSSGKKSRYINHLCTTHECLDVHSNHPLCFFRPPARHRGFM